MRITFDVDTEDLMFKADLAALQRIFDSWAEMLAKPVKADPKEEKAALDTVREIIKEPQPKEEKLEPAAKPEKKRTAKQEQDIQAIKDAVEKLKLKKAKEPEKKQPIDDSLIIYMRDEQHMKLKDIARELGCCEQTVLNRYNKAKRGKL